jgi:ribonuclease HI
MKVTLHVDTSYCVKTGALGWGAVLQLFGTSVDLSGHKIGQFKHYEVTGTLEALSAAYHILFDLDSRMDFEELNLIFDADEIARKMNCLPTAHFKTVNLKSVKSHSKPKNSLAATNSHCDSLAKLRMKELRNVIRNIKR